MPGPASAGVFVYALDLASMTRFYEGVLGLERLRETHDLVVLDAPPLQVVLNAMPPEAAARARAHPPPRGGHHWPYKFFFTVASLADAAATARSLGGDVLPEVYRGPGFIVQNFVDPEGNVFHLRERTNAASAAL